jgi:hypothetical protein
MPRTSLLVKVFLVDSFGIAFQGQGPVFQVGQYEVRHPKVIIEDVGLRETISWIKVLFKVRQGEPSPC